MSAWIAPPARLAWRALLQVRLARMGESERSAGSATSCRQSSCGFRAPRLYRVNGNSVALSPETQDRAPLVWERDAADANPQLPPDSP